MEYDLKFTKEEIVHWGYGVKGEVRQIIENEFWNILSYECPNKLAYCQIFDTDRLRDYIGRKNSYMMINAVLFVYEDFSLVVEYAGMNTCFWKVAICHHEYTEIGIKRLNELCPNITFIGNCSHYYECKKCHKVQYIDSSG